MNNEAPEVIVNGQVPNPIDDQFYESLGESLAKRLEDDKVCYILPIEMRAHMARVETMTNLLERLGEAIATSPYAAMLPADLVNDLKGTR